MRIAQINAQRAMAATASLEILIKEFDIDVLCIQEPYVSKNSIRGFNSPGLVKLRPCLEDPWVIAIIANDEIDIFQLSYLDTQHVMCFRVTSSKNDFYIINAYCQFSLEIEPILRDIECILKKLNGGRFVISMDANAKSGIWYADETDARGKIIEEFLIANKLYTINKQNNPPTYFSSQGQSNIDLTMVSENMLSACSNWKVSEVCTTSDHNLILFDVDMKGDINRIFLKHNLYNIKRANWKDFTKLTKEQFNDDIKAELGSKDPDEAVRLFNKILASICSKTIPRKKRCNYAIPWWNEELAKLRKEASSAKNYLTRVRSFDQVDFLESARLKYKFARNKYTAKIRRAKRDAWQDFVTKESNKDPWSMPYKIIRDKIKEPEIMSSLVLPDGTITSSWKESASALINKCIPKDNKEIEGICHQEIKMKISSYKNQNIENMIFFDEIDLAIKKLKNNTAPGFDKFTSEIIKEFWKSCPDVIMIMLNNCFKNCIFPKEWKKAQLKIIVKGKNKDIKQLNSYRPISLLPTMSKVFERIILNRIKTCYKELSLENKNQYGFKKGKSTEDAIIHLLHSTNNSQKKYVVALFVDIQGAFDNLWWTTIKERLTKANCSSSLIKLITSYFKHRKVSIKSKFDSITCWMQRGCPQGSIIGPMAWNWCMDTLLDEIMNLSIDKVEAIAYADDVVLLIKANSRMELEKIARIAVNALMRWCKLHKLMLSASKTTAMLIKGKLDKDRSPIIKINDAKVKFTNQTKYLGVLLDEKLSFIPYVKFLREKLIKLTMNIRRIAREKWGIKYHTRRFLYDMVALPIASYAASAWFDKAGNVMVRRHLLAAQRALLLMNTGATRTTSTVAMQVIAGITPLDFAIIERGLKNTVRRNLTVTWKNYVYQKKDNIEDINMEEEFLRIEHEIWTNWQQKWTNDVHGRQTYRFITCVSFAKANTWFKPNRQCVYILTGYGPIRSTLYLRGSEETSTCPVCGWSNETVEHILLDCPGYRNIRYEGVYKYKESAEDMIGTKESFEMLQNFANKIFNVRSTYL